MSLFNRKNAADERVLDECELAAEKIVNRASRRVGCDRKTTPGKVKQFLLCTTAFVVLTLGFVLVGLSSVIWICVNGPSTRARELLVASLKETSAAGFVADIFVPKAEIDFILNGSGDEYVDQDTNTDLIQIPNGSGDDAGEVESDSVQNDNVTNSQDDLEIIDVVGATYRGKVVIIKDPSRVFLGVSGQYGGDNTGITLGEIVDKYDATLGVNASGFADTGGNGNGGTPVGLVISGGKLLWGGKNTEYGVIGFDKNNILIIDYMTAGEAIDAGIRDAMSWGPFLVKNGEPIYNNGGVNPRTAIGQRADGSVLLAVIEGRQISSMGATMRDMTNLMLDLGAVNAANLDGGSSSSLYKDGQYIIEGSYVFGTRDIPNGFLVK